MTIKPRRVRSWRQPRFTLAVPQSIAAMHRSLPIPLSLALLMGLPEAARALEGDWRLFRIEPAPWATGSLQLPPAPLDLGTRVQFLPQAARGAGVLECSGARFEKLVMPAEGLFQGGLPKPASDAQALGLQPMPVPTVRMDCDSGSFDFHRADADTLLMALDHHILSFSRAEGAIAAADSPEAAIQELIERHLSSDTRFLAASWAAKASRFSADLGRAIEEWFAVDWPGDEPPPIQGDPLTDSQERPTRFAVRSAVRKDERAWVPVDFADAWRSRRVIFVLTQDSSRWLLADVEYSDGASLLQLLQERPG